MADSERSADCWISALSFCELHDRGNILDVGSMSHGFVLTPTNGRLWPLPTGKPTRDLGCVLAIEQSQTHVDLGVAIVVYGRGLIQLAFSLFEDEQGKAPQLIYQYSVPIHTGAPLHCDGPGPNWKRVRLHHCPIHAPGRYFLLATANERSAMRIPLYVHALDEWIRMERERNEQARADHPQKGFPDQEGEE